MTRLRVWLIGLLGLTLPVALAGGAWLLSSSSLGEADPLPIPTGSVATGNPSLVIPDGNQGEGRASAAPTATDGRDVSGNCDEAEHQDDPECAGASPSGTDRSGRSEDSEGGDSSGPGSGGSGGGDGDSSGPGSGGSGGGNGDSSGTGSGGGGDDDSSGTGSGGGGDDDSAGTGGGDDDY